MLWTVFMQCHSHTHLSKQNPLKWLLNELINPRPTVKKNSRLWLIFINRWCFTKKKKSTLLDKAMDWFTKPTNLLIYYLTDWLTHHEKWCQLKPKNCWTYIIKNKNFQYGKNNKYTNILNNNAFCCYIQLFILVVLLPQLNNNESNQHKNTIC